MTIRRRTDTFESQEFWRSVEKAAADSRKRPEWQRVGLTVPPQYAPDCSMWIGDYSWWPGATDDCRCMWD